MEKRATPESYYLSKPEPYQSCLLALKDVVLRANPGICHERKFQIPFLLTKGKNWATYGLMAES